MADIAVQILEYKKKDIESEIKADQERIGSYRVQIKELERRIALKEKQIAVIIKAIDRL